MRRAKDGQGTFEFQPATLKLTDEYHERYRRIDELLRDVPEILRRVHADLRKALERANRRRSRRCNYTSDNVLRVAICQIIEGASLREIVVRVDDSNFLRRFCRFGPDRMMGHTLFCTLRNAIRPTTWRAINGMLAKHAVGEGLITGSELRVDTTACETNIHYPTDSSLLYDGDRVIARLIEKVREIDPALAGTGRIRLRDVRRRSQRIGHKAGKKGGSAIFAHNLVKLARGPC